MKFKIDENLPTELVTDLRNLGHDADTAFDEGLTGATDPVLVEAASKENRILLTLDKGIANLEQYPAERHSGVVLFRVVRSGRGSVLTFIRERLASLLETGSWTQADYCWRQSNSRPLMSSSSPSEKAWKRISQRQLNPSALFQFSVESFKVWRSQAVKSST